MDLADKSSAAEILEKEPENWDLRCKVAEDLSLQGKLKEAETLLDTAPEPPEFEIHILKIAELYSKTNPSKAVPMLHEFLEQCPDSAIGHLAMAEAAGKLRDKKSATRYYQAAIELNKNYRDPDFESKYGIELENAPPALTAKTESVPVAEEPPTAETGRISIQESAQRSRKSADSEKEEGGAGVGWLIGVMSGIVVFLVGWLIVILVIKATFGG